MAAVYHNSGDIIVGVVIFFAEGAVIFVQEFANEFIDLFAEEVWRVFGLLEEESCWILQFLHLI